MALWNTFSTKLSAPPSGNLQRLQSTYVTNGAAKNTFLTLISLFCVLSSYSAPEQEQSIVKSTFVCLSANISPWLHIQSSPLFLYTLPTTVARSSYGGVALQYTLCNKSGCMDGVMFARIKARNRRRQQGVCWKWLNRGQQSRTGGGVWYLRLQPCLSFVTDSLLPDPTKPPRNWTPSSAGITLKLKPIQNPSIIGDVTWILRYNKCLRRGSVRRRHLT